MNQVEQSVVSKSVDLYGKTYNERISRYEKNRDTRGYIKFRIRKKANPGVKDRVMKKSNEEVYNKTKDSGDDVYDNFVNR